MHLSTSNHPGACINVVNVSFFRFFLGFCKAAKRKKIQKLFEWQQDLNHAWL